MKPWILLSLSWLCLGAACPIDEQQGRDPDPQDTIPKWDFAGLHAPEDGNDSSYFTHVVAHGKSLFVLDARGRVWEGGYGSDRWNLMEEQPAGGFFMIRILDSALYGGALRTAGVFRYDLRTRQSGKPWEALTQEGLTGRRVMCLAMLGNILLATASSRDSTDTVAVYRLDPGEAAWRPWNDQWPVYDAAPNLAAWNQKMYAATWDHGVWRRGLEDSSWERLPDPRDSGFDVPKFLPRSLGVHKGELYVGYYAGSVYRLDTAKLVQGVYPWVDVRNTRFASGKEDLPQIVLSLYSHLGRFYAAGKEFSTPMVYSEKLGKWVWLGNYCPENETGRNICGGLTTYELAAIEDTLYAAGNKHIMKFPVARVPD